MAKPAPVAPPSKAWSAPVSPQPARIALTPIAAMYSLIDISVLLFPHSKKQMTGSQRAVTQKYSTCSFQQKYAISMCYGKKNWATQG
jgi:hypothetical protein